MHAYTHTLPGMCVRARTSAHTRVRSRCCVCTHMHTHKHEHTRTSRYTQSMEVDSHGRMWMIDVGRLNIFSEDPDDVVDGPAQLVIWDIATNAELDRFILPENVAPAAGNFLNDIVVDEKRMIAYISGDHASHHSPRLIIILSMIPFQHLHPPHHIFTHHRQPSHMIAQMLKRHPSWSST